MKWQTYSLTQMANVEITLIVLRTARKKCCPSSVIAAPPTSNRVVEATTTFVLLRLALIRSDFFIIGGTAKPCCSPCIYRSCDRKRRPALGALFRPMLHARQVHAERTDDETVRANMLISS
jgi:hypothetical protein